VDALCAALPVPEDVAPIMQDLTLPEFAASALLKAFVERYAGGDGDGLMSGMDRYRRLEERAQQAAVQAGTLFTFWGHLCRTMMVPGAVGETDAATLRLLTLPAALGQMVLRVLSETPAPVVMIARFWNETAKRQSPDYVLKAGGEAASEGMRTLQFSADSLLSPGGYLTVQLPTYSANGLRHELIREPLLWHLFDRLGLAFDEPLGARTALHYNGGALKRSGSAETFWLRKSIREAYPHLALLSGSTDTFLIGESNLRLQTWLACRENRQALSEVPGPIDGEALPSAFDLLDRVTLTRHASRLAGQDGVQTAMPFTFETLVPGTVIYARLALTPYAQELEEGALATAVHVFQELDGTLGGQSARGYGRVRAEWIGEGPGHRDAYEDYITGHADALRDGVMDGTLTTGREVITE